MYRQYVQSGIAPGANTVTTSAIAANTIQPWQLSSSLLNPTVNSFTGDGTTTSFTLSLPPASANTVVVTVNGITQSPVTNYSTNNTSLVFTSAPSNASVIRAVQQAMIGTSIVPIDGSVTTSKLGSNLTLSGNTAFSGAISGTSATLSSTLGVTGVTTLTAQPILSSLTASSAVATDASKGLVSVTNTGSGNNVLSASPTLTGTVAAASLSLSSLTSGRVTYAGASGLLSDSSTLTYDGTTLTTPRLALGGTTLPSAGTSTLFLRSSDNCTYLQTGSGNNIYFLDGSQNTMLSLTPTSLGFQISNAAKLTLNSSYLYTASGISVGIGTATPARVLELKAAQACMVFNDNTNVWTVGTGSFIDGSNSFNFYLGGVGSYLRIDASGNLGLGLGLVPNAGWASSAYRALQLGQRGVIMFYETGASVLNIGNNFYYDGTAYKRLTADYVSQYQQATGAHNWRISGTGAADSTISWTQAMTLDTSGRLGIGITSPVAPLNIMGLTSSTSTPILYLQQGGAYPSYGYTFKIDNVTTGNLYLNRYDNNADVGNLLTITSGGFLGINTANATSPVTPRAYLDVRGANIAIGSTALDAAQGQAFIGSSNNWGTNIGGTLALGGTQNSGTLTATYASISGRREPVEGYLYNGYMQFGVSDGANVVERMRIDSSGRLLIGTTSSIAASGGAYFQLSATKANWLSMIEDTGTSGNLFCQYLRFGGSTPNDATSMFFYCGDAAGQKMSVKANGGIYNYSANDSNLSDEREKKNIQLAPNYLDKICQIPVKTFLYNDQTDTDLNLGVIAQDVEAICPELIMESNWANKDEEPKIRKSIYQTDLQYALMKCIQEQQALIESLTTTVNSQAQIIASIQEQLGS